MSSVLRLFGCLLKGLDNELWPSDSKTDAGVVEATLDMRVQEDEDDPCWICLQIISDEEKLPQSFCDCPNRPAHKRCLAQWQLQKAGTREEMCCRFCSSKLPHWADDLELDPEARPVMCIWNNSKPHIIHPKRDAGGLADFKEQVAKIMQLDNPDQVSLAFDCVNPFSGKRMTMTGPETYDAAMCCAAIAATRRRKRDLSKVGDHKLVSDEEGNERK